jgi:hypothetical protein
MTQEKSVTNDITTRLLAQENLMIQRAPVSTASFDIVNRILTLPQWQNMTPEIEEMLKAHEVAHALYTDFEEFEKCKEVEGRTGLAHAYLNILEDARIEKLMKRKFPGLRTVFTKGYGQLNERDFFGISKLNTNNLLLIDKINLYYKVGFNSGITFTTAEKYLVEQVARLESVQEVVTLARKIYDFSKKQRALKLQDMLDDNDFSKALELDENEEANDLDLMDEIDMSGGGYEEAEEVKEEEDEDKPSGRGSGSEFNKETTEFNAEGTEPGPITSHNLEEKLAQHADTTVRYTYMDMPRMGVFADRIIVPYKKVLTDNIGAVQTLLENPKLSEHYRQYWSEKAKTLPADYDKFIAETTRVVTYLVKEFEMRKAATDYKRVQISKSGVLDPAKLASYKIREDLFRSVTKTKDGKKHGMLFVLDWSGSMSEYLNETVQQLISLVQFCHRVKVPFQVFAFTDHYLGYADEDQQAEKERSLRIEQMKIEMLGQFDKTLAVDTRFNMIELFSNRMTNAELQRMSRTMFNMAHGFCHRDYQLGGTPLNEALSFLYDYAETFVQQNQVEKFTLVKLSDGDGGRIHYYTERSLFNPDKGSYYCTSPAYTTFDYDGNKRMKNIRYLRDSITKKVYEVESSHIQWGNLITRLIKDRYNCGVIGFHVTAHRARDIQYALKTYELESSQDQVYNARRDMLKDNFAGLTVYGHDEMFLMKADIKIEDDKLDENLKNSSAASIAKKFSKYLTGKKTSRVLLNRFVEVVA